MNSRFFVFSILLLSYSNSATAQAPKKLKEFSPGAIEKVSVDRLGNLFLIFKDGSIRKYDPNGNVLAKRKKGEIPTLIEPWFHPRIYMYFKSNQASVFFDHSMEVTDMQKIDPSVAVNPELVCPTNDNKLLVLDEGDWSVKKIVNTADKVTTEFNLDTTGIGAKPNFVCLKEYQNLIFLLEEKRGIFIFSNFGKLVNQIKCTVGNFGFFGEELFYLLNDKVIFYDLYTEKRREVKLESGRFVIVTDERIFLVKNNDRVAIYEFITIPEEK